jgi:ABC-type transport system substrate-binding protein
MLAPDINTRCVQALALLRHALAFFIALGFFGGSIASADYPEIVLHLPMTTAGPNSLDPVRGSSAYDNKACNYIYESLLEYEYLHRPFKLKPCLLEAMPESFDNGKRFRFQLKKGIRFHDDPCFPDGKGREVVADDFFYSLKRMADNENQPKGWWLLKDTIVGFDEYRKEQNQADQFDYDQPVEGMVKISDHEFEILLNEPFYRFIYTLAMFQTAIVPREAVEFYGDRFSRHPVGTGPYLLKRWQTGSRMTYVRNPTYRLETYPADPGMNADGTEPYPGYQEDVDLGFYEDAGKPLPISDRIEVTMFVESQPMWLKFLNREIEYSTVPRSAYEQAFIKRNRRLRDTYADQGIRSAPVPLLDMIYNGFNMEDPDFGGYEDSKKYVRQAISLMYNYDEINEAFYAGQNLIYDGPIPAGMDGHPENHNAPKNYRGPNIQKARKLLEKAGYPNGKGLPPLQYYTSRQPESLAMAEMNKRNLAEIGIKMKIDSVDFATLSEMLREKRATFFGLAWGSDYPDAENNLQLFYGPYKSPMSNNFNYDRPEFNKLYEEVRVMPPSDERTKKYIQMRDMIIEDCPMIGSMARTRNYLIHEHLKNFKPVEVFSNWPKYLNIERP